MSHHHQAHDGDRSSGGLLTSRWALAFLGFVVIAGILLFTEHRAHVLGTLI